MSISPSYRDLVLAACVHPLDKTLYVLTFRLCKGVMAFSLLISMRHPTFPASFLRGEHGTLLMYNGIRIPLVQST
jgi:hypothetical protein